MSKAPYGTHRRMLFEEAQHKCYYCGAPLSLKSMTVDHIIPLCFGGSTDYDNKVCSCRACNNKKGLASVSELVRSWNHKRRSAYMHRVEQDFQEGRISAGKYVRLTGKQITERLRVYSKLHRRLCCRKLNVSINVWVSEIHVA